MARYSSETQTIIDVVTKNHSNVLICGPTGSGKSRLARIIHQLSAREGKPFVSVNLATVHEGTLESELFGHERGAFTGADRLRVGRLELANHGTIFLDEIGEISTKLQARLLDFLQNRTIVRVGGNEEIMLDVRVIAATNVPLGDAVLKGTFREDLFHRLRVFQIDLESLNDFSPIQFEQAIRDVYSECTIDFTETPLPISRKLIETLAMRNWSGNFREMKNVLEYASVLGRAQKAQELGPEHLPRWFLSPVSSSHASPIGVDSKVVPEFGTVQMVLGSNFHENIYRFEKEFLRRALSRYRGRINQTSRKIGLSKGTLLRRIRAYDLVNYEIK